MKYIIDQIKTQLKSGLGQKIRYYYTGEPEILPKEVVSRGYVCIKPITDNTELVETQTDQGLYTIQIVVGRDVRREWNKKPDEFMTTKWLMEIVQNTDSNGDLQTDTIKYILRDNLTSIGKVHVMSIDYEDKQRGEEYTSEARITLEILTIRRLI